MRGDVVEQERCAALRKERGSAASRFLRVSEAIWSLSNTLLQRETRRNAWLFGYEGQSALRFDPPPVPALRGGRVRITKQTPKCSPYPPIPLYLT